MGGPLANAQFCLEVSEMEINPGSADANPGHFTVVRDKMVYAAEGILGDELYIYDNTNGTNTAIDIHPGNRTNGNPNDSNPVDFNIVGTKVVYKATGEQGTELYVYDTETKVNTLFDLHPGTPSSGPRNFLVAGNKVFFNAF